MSAVNAWITYNDLRQEKEKNIFPPFPCTSRRINYRGPPNNISTTTKKRNVIFRCKEAVPPILSYIKNFNEDFSEVDFSRTTRHKASYSVNLECIRDIPKPISENKYLATGCSLTELHYNYRVGISTASEIIQETCKLIWIFMKEQCIPKPTREKWLEIADEREPAVDTVVDEFVINLNQTDSDSNFMETEDEDSEGEEKDSRILGVESVGDPIVYEINSDKMYTNL
ncbi:unnamed protein product [Acanthoscelides obtectus]|uniref:Uncharacterized protein n=1 Tax=Acanthoscelides obtectus TaxID=200917 RepID=A0A9P0L2B6_ACAOB|nr:unnamed protein product [Acanthoscelides obtectus]CAK1649509.1 hypothetical protein AOBTE_LOCUS16282 [Acanthoscelides obtectus]